MNFFLIFSIWLVGSAAFAEQCEIISIRANKETVVGRITLSGRSNNGVIPGGFAYEISSTPGPVDMIYLKNTSSGQIVQASGPIVSEETPLYVSTADTNGNGAAVRCLP